MPAPTFNLPICSLDSKSPKPRERSATFPTNLGSSGVLGVIVDERGARSGLSLVRKATHGEVTFHARPHCMAIVEGWGVHDKSLKTLGRVGTRLFRLARRYMDKRCGRPGRSALPDRRKCGGWFDASAASSKQRGRPKPPLVTHGLTGVQRLAWGAGTRSCIRPSAAWLRWRLEMNCLNSLSSSGLTASLGSSLLAARMKT
ncbi:MAG: hypothetical protein RLZZ550_5 [Verrucomicrobiota bacterium]|jgi:hypothetical protein